MEKLIKDLTDNDITFGYDSKGFLTFPSTQKGGTKRPYYLWNESFFEELYGEDIARRVKQQTNKNPFLKSEIEKLKNSKTITPKVVKSRYFDKKINKILNIKSKTKVKRIGGIEPQEKLIKLAKKGKEKIIQSQKQRFRTGLEKLQEQYGLTPTDYDEYTPAVMRRREGDMLWSTIPGLR
jgi:hypothetical protein